MRRFHALLFLAALAAGCDTPPVAEGVSFQNVDLDARGDASLSVSGGALVVSSLTGSRSGGFTVDGQPGRLDVDVDPLAIPAGGRFGIEVEDASGADVASFYVTGNAAGALDFLYDFGTSLGVAGVLIHYKIGGENGEIVFGAQIDGGNGRLRGALAETSGGTGSGTTGSTHVIRDNGKYIVVSDSNGDGARHADCDGFRVTPPAPYSRASYCTDWIEIEPLITAPMPQGTVSVTARGVGSFTVRDLNASY